MDPRVTIAPQIPFVDDAAQGICRYSPKVFSDPELLECERRRIFDQSWLYAGHESEVRQAGDFLTRRVGGRPRIIVRGAEARISSFHSPSTHRVTQGARPPTCSPTTS